jgi:uncharacterized protein Yka (UPF0111/DUF47 family)
VAKTTIDELLAAIELVRILQQTIGKHDQAIAQIIDRIEQVEKRLDDLPEANLSEPK